MSAFVDYARRNGLAKRYGYGVLLAVVAGIGGVVSADPANVVFLKVLFGALFAIAATGLPLLFDAEASRRPFSASYLERAGLETLCISIFIAGISWRPELEMARSVSIFATITVAMFALRLGAAAYFRRR